MDLSKLSPSQRVLESTRYVVENAQYVTLGDQGAVDAAAVKILDGLASQSYSTSTWRSHPLHPQVPDASAAEFIFFLDLLNFSFWASADEPPFTVRYRGADYTGYWALVAAMRRALDDDGVDLISARWMAQCDDVQMAHVLRSETPTPAPLLKERAASVRTAGQVLLERFDGSFVNVIRAAGGSAQALIKLVLEHFPTFRDEATYNGRRVYLYKRVQILIADLWACFDTESFGAFSDIGSLTMFADYRVPQALVHLGLLCYSDELLRTLRASDTEGLLANGDAREVEIRACSIWAVERVKAAIEARVAAARGNDDATRGYAGPINSIMLDFYIWDLAKAQAEEMKDVPIHRTRSVYY